MDENPPAILYEILRGRGLSVTIRENGTVAVGNPLHPRIGAVVATVNRRYLTDYGYELGEQGDEQATADRLAFLLSAPVDSIAHGAPVPTPEVGQEFSDAV